jgi:rod shape-determining protein MreC
MRNLIAFIGKHYAFFLFLILESACIALMVANNNYHQAAFVNSANNVSGYVFGTVSDITQYFYLKETNEQLARENARLNTLSTQAMLTDSVPSKTVVDSTTRQQYVYINARVLNNSVNKRNNYLTLDKGQKAGIKPESAVICSNGVVGIVKDVSENFSTVLSVLNKDSKVSAKIKHGGYFGSLVWQGGNYQFATLNDIPTHVRLHKGDTILTNTFSTIFPEDIMIGTVESYFIKPGQNFFTITIKLSTNFKTVNHVYVVTDLLKEERRQLEEKSQHD